MGFAAAWRLFKGPVAHRSLFRTVPVEKVSGCRSTPNTVKRVHGAATVAHRRDVSVATLGAAVEQETWAVLTRNGFCFMLRISWGYFSWLYSTKWIHPPTDQNSDTFLCLCTVVGTTETTTTEGRFHTCRSCCNLYIALTLVADKQAKFRSLPFSLTWNIFTFTNGRLTQFPSESLWNIRRWHCKT